MAQSLRFGWFTHKEQRLLAIGFADEDGNLARAFCLAGEQQRLALRYRALRLINIEPTQRPQNQSSVTWGTDLTVRSPRLKHRRNEGICLKLS
jgi:hypothetical protein